MQKRFEIKILKILCIAVLLSFIGFIFVFSCSKTPEVERIFTSGHIITMNENMPEAEAFAVGGGVIAAVGTNAEIRIPM